MFALLVLWSSWNIFTESIQMLLEGILVGMELNEVESSIRYVNGVLNMHNLHVWTISPGLIACSCHILVAEQGISGRQKILKEVTHMLEHDF